MTDWVPLSWSQNPAHGDVITGGFLHDAFELWTKAWNNLREKAVLVAESEEDLFSMLLYEELMCI